VTRARGEPAPARLRRAHPQDLEIVLGLIAEFYAVDGHTYDDALLRGALGPLLLDDACGVVWLVRGGDAADAGYAIVTWGYSLESGGRDVLLDELYIRDRGRGVGGAVLQEVLAECRRRGLGRMFLETETPNDGARNFYGRHGFAVDDSIWMSRHF
jgi:GNAT superfamily N-acetyltransferase